MYKSFIGKSIGINYQSGVSQRDEYRIRQGQTPSYEVNWATPHPNYSEVVPEARYKLPETEAYV